MTFHNLTPHTIVIRSANGDTLVVKPSGAIARVAVHEHLNECIDGIQFVERELGVPHIPVPEAFKAGDYLIVSSMVLEAVRNADGIISAVRHALCSPDTGATAVRNAAGQIEAVTRLVIL